MFVLVSLLLSNALARSLVFGDRVIIDRVTVRHAPRSVTYPAHEKKYFISVEEPAARALLEKLFVAKESPGRLPHAEAVLTLDDRDFSSIPTRHGPHTEGPMFLGFRGRLHLEIGGWWQRKIATADVALIFFGHRDVSSDHFSAAALTDVDGIRAFEFAENAARGSALLEKITRGNSECARRLGESSQSGARK